MAKKGVGTDEVVYCWHNFGGFIFNSANKYKDVSLSEIKQVDQQWQETKELSELMMEL